jgi:hypothetical protein
MLGIWESGIQRANTGRARTERIRGGELDKSTATTVGGPTMAMGNRQPVLFPECILFMRAVVFENLKYEIRNKKQEIQNKKKYSNMIL